MYAALLSMENCSCTMGNSSLLTLTGCWMKQARQKKSLSQGKHQGKQGNMKEKIRKKKPSYFFCIISITTTSQLLHLTANITAIT
jgi:hypothetical protein